VNSPKPTFSLESPSVRHNHISQITASILAYVANQLIDLKGLPLSLDMSFVPYVACASFPVGRSMLQEK